MDDNFMFFKQKTAYEMRISDWSSDVCSSDLWQASSSVRRPARTAVTTSALRRITHRLVEGGGRSSRLSGLPAGPITLFCLPELSEYIEPIPSLISNLKSRQDRHSQFKIR